MAKNRVTLKMIAEEAKVSTSLVSNILNGKGNASPKVQEIVEKLLEKHGFQPKSRQRPVIFIAKQERVSPFLSQIMLSMLSGLSSVFSANKIQLQFELAEQVSANQLYHIFSRNPAGVIVLTGSELHGHVVKLGQKMNIPVIQTGYDDELADANAVVVDSYYGAYRATSYLLKNNYRRIAFIRWECSSNSRKKFSGYTNALADAGVPYDEKLVFSAPASRSLLKDHGQLGRYSLEQIFARCGDNPPDALLVENGFLSPSLMYSLKSDHGEMPRQIAELPMIHFEDIPFDNLSYIVSSMLGHDLPQGMRIHIDWNQLGCSAGMMMTQLLSNVRSRLQPQTIRIEPVLEPVCEENSGKQS